MQNWRHSRITHSRGLSPSQPVVYDRSCFFYELPQGTRSIIIRTSSRENMVRIGPHILNRATAAILFCCSAGPAFPQRGAEAEIPNHFRLDVQVAEKLRPQLLAVSVAATGRFIIGRIVLDRLVSQAAAPADLKPKWELRIVKDGQLNAYASPDGSIYVENGLAELAGPSSGLWAAILSHEIAHVLRRDWARRYLFEKNLEGGAGFPIVLGDSGLASASWSSADKASQDLGRYCRQLEMEADVASMMLMARAGYHPDFVPSLHHILHAQETGARPKSLAAMHPCWEERDQQLRPANLAASIEFNRRWPEWYASPGGNPPVVVFAEEPTVRKTDATSWEILVPLRCQNLAGAVEVVLTRDSKRLEGRPLARLPQEPDSADVRELTGCTSPRTTVTLRVSAVASTKSARQSSDVYVVDAWGDVLAKAELPKPLR